MEAAAFEEVYEAFGDFHAYFGPLFGRREWRDHSRTYLQALLVQSQERRNAENLSESVGVSARAMQRFLTEARWDDDRVVENLQEYLGPKLAPRLGHPEGVWVLDSSDFPKQGRKSVGVARQYCGSTAAGWGRLGQVGAGWGRLGQVANCQVGMFLAYVSPLGRRAGGQTPLSAGELDLGPRPVHGGGGAGGEEALPVEACPELAEGTELALEMVERALARGHLKAGWVAADDAFGISPSFPGGAGVPGDELRPGRAGGLHGVAGETGVDYPRPTRDGAAPPGPGWWAGSGVPWRSAAMNCRRMPGGR